MQTTPVGEINILAGSQKMHVGVIGTNTVERISDLRLLDCVVIRFLLLSHNFQFERVKIKLRLAFKPCSKGTIFKRLQLTFELEIILKSLMKKFGIFLEKLIKYLNFID